MRGKGIAARLKRMLWQASDRCAALREGAAGKARKAAYEQELARQTDPYGTWIREEEPQLLQQALTGSRRGTGPDMPEVVLFAEDPERLSPETCRLVQAAFAEDPSLRLWYADEDVAEDGGRRHDPWFKPEWSPETLRYLNYIGSIYAMQRKDAAGLELGSQNPADVPGNVPGVTVTSFAAAGGQEAVYARLRTLVQSGAWDGAEVRHEPLILYHAAAMPELLCSPVAEVLEQTPATRVIIPSKDHPELLERCLSSFLQYTDYPAEQLEICVVDNGSSPENRSRMAALFDRMSAQSTVRFRYLYEPAEFNFSAMCNRGAEADGAPDLFLFLNDDIEIPESGAGWLRRMAAAAVRPGIGAVGAKLLYPVKDEAGHYRIQHAGITNLAIGPGHKLLNDPDDGSTAYHGFGTRPVEMLAVTGACLMVQRVRFRAVDGFDESLAVAYNDVALCMSLHEKGYRNLQRNDITLLHHESASRGTDETPERRARRLAELSRLYELHPAYRGWDPYYSRYLKGDSQHYEIATHFDWEDETLLQTPEVCAQPREEVWQDALPEIGQVAVQVDRQVARDRMRVQIDRMEQEDGVILVEGWAFLQGADNAGRTVALLWRPEGGGCYRIRTVPRLRRDVAAVYPQERNILLCGFVARWKLLRVMFV